MVRCPRCGSDRIRENNEVLGEKHVFKCFYCRKCGAHFAIMEEVE